MKIVFRCYIMVVLLTGVGSCKKFVQVPPPDTQLVGSTVYSSNATAESAINAIYLSMGGNNGAGGSIGGGKTGISALLGLSADEFSLYTSSNSIIAEAYVNGLVSTTPAPMWNDLYNVIYQANSAIEGITASTGVTAPVKQQLIGEAKFIRAFCYFYLVNIYGAVPLITSADYSVNKTADRTVPSLVYQQIISDLKDAKGALGANYVTPSGATTAERARPNNAVATALLARVYLYTDSFPNADAQASAVIGNSNYSLDRNLDNIFLATSKEAIWQLEMPTTGFNTPDATAFLLSAYGGPSSTYPIILSDSLVNHFAPGDLRATHWVNSLTVLGQIYYFPYKYKMNATPGKAPLEYPVVLRLAEQYLIRAEARAEQGNLTGAAADVDSVRVRAGLLNVTYTGQQDLLNAIYTERRFELFTEYGHRWLDMIRTGNVNFLMSGITPKKGGTWVATDQLYPIPLSEIQTDPNLTQNPGY